MRVAVVSKTVWLWSSSFLLLPPFHREPTCRVTLNGVMSVQVWFCVCICVESVTVIPGIALKHYSHPLLWLWQRNSSSSSSTMDEASSRRLAVLERQCCAGPGPSSSRQSQQEQQQQSSYASVTGSPSSYARVHGQVSRAPANWREIQVVARERLEEVKYAKSEEGIAKVGKLLQQMAVAN
jgi:hypothetical protein